VFSMHNDNKIDESTGVDAKPEMISFYNQTKSGVDVVDRMVASYNIAHNTRHWPVMIFFSLLNVAATNTFVIYRENNPNCVNLENVAIISKEFVKINK
jgi:hypothetical protein